MKVYFPWELTYSFQKSKGKVLVFLFHHGGEVKPMSCQFHVESINQNRILPGSLTKSPLKIAISQKERRLIFQAWLSVNSILDLRGCFFDHRTMTFWTDLVTGLSFDAAFDGPPQKSNELIPKIAIFKGNSLFQGPSFWGPPC